jgi:predicted RNase H-like HicB family nuclease
MEKAIATLIEASAGLTNAVTALVKAGMTADELNANAEAAMEAMTKAGEKDPEPKAEDKPKRTHKAKAEPAKVGPAKVEPAKEPETVEETIIPDEVGEDEPTYTLVEVRSKLAGLSQAGKQAQVKALIESFGAAKLTEIDPSQYAEVMKKAEAL